MKPTFKTYVLFWLSQTLSQLGSSMTAFALILWAFEAEGSALTVSLMAFCNYVPYVAASLLSGGWVDRLDKKKILLCSDLLAAAGTAWILLHGLRGSLTVGQVYLVNALTGLMHAFQSPAAGVAVGALAPKDRLAQVSGMQAFSGNAVSVVTPVLAAALYGLGGLPLILAIDLATFAAAFLTLLLWIRIPESRGEGKPASRAFAGCREGYAFLRADREVLRLVVSIAVINFFSRLTYENILSPMILARSGGDHAALSLVNAVMGLAGIAGGLLVSAQKEIRRPFRAVYLSACLSFLTGDLLMAVGRGPILWSAAGAAASLPIPLIFAGQNLIFYRRIPREVQGRVFAVRNAIQYSTIPLGILLGGFLADRVFEPFMASGHAPAQALQAVVGSGAGSGMALMFLCTGLLGGGFSLWMVLRSKK